MISLILLLLCSLFFKKISVLILIVFFLLLNLGLISLSFFLPTILRWNVRLSIDSRTSKLLYWTVAARQLLSRWGDRFLELLTLPSSQNPPKTSSFLGWPLAFVLTPVGLFLAVSFPSPLW